MTARKQISRKDGGFTLLELILAISTLAVITLIIGGALRLSYRSVERGEARIQAQERLRIAINLIESQLQSFLLISRVEEGSTKYVFAGNREGLQLPSNFSVWGINRGYVMARYRIETDPQGKKTLFITEAPVDTTPVREIKLLEGFDLIAFTFFHKEPTAEKGEWVEEWIDNLSTPEKIRLTLAEGTRVFTYILPLRVKGTMSVGSVPAVGKR